ARFHLLVGLDLELRAVDHRIAFTLATAIVDDDDFTVAVGRHQIAIPVGDRAQVVELDRAGALRLVLGGLHDAARRAADVERPHRELRARLADRLRRDDADGLAELGETSVAQIAPIAHDTDASLRIAGEARANTHGLDDR